MTCQRSCMCTSAAPSAVLCESVTVSQQQDVSMHGNTAHRPWNMLISQVACGVQAHMLYLTGSQEGVGCRVLYLMGWHSWSRRDLTFLRYTGCQKAMAKMCAQLTGEAGSNTLVGFGNWGARDSAGIIKKCPATPTRRLLHQLRRRCTVVMVDEFRTSKLCAQCNAVNQNMLKWEDRPGGGGQRKVRVHAVLVCTNRLCKVRVNRDCNAARNILALLLAMLSGSRPKPFCRGHVFNR